MVGNAVSPDAIAKAFNVSVAGLIKDHADICIESIQGLHKRYKWPPFVSRAFIDEQPVALRRALFRADKLHTADLKRQLKTDPYFHLDAPAVLARKVTLENALVGIASTELSWSDVAELAEDTSYFESNLPRIRAAIARERTGRYCPPRHRFHAFR